MADTNFLTTRSARWSSDMPNALPQWSDREGFHVDFAENDKAPLEYIQALANNGTCVEEHRSTKLGKVVAVKKMDTYSDTARNEKLNKEVAILRILRHYHSIRIIGSYTHRDLFGILTEPVATCDLKVYLAEPSSRKVAYMDKLVGRRDLFLPQIMGCLAYVLIYIHKLQIRHRDIKPANILLDGAKVLFADFGLSKTFTRTQTGSSGPSLKTFMYASPERVSDLHRNTSCDIFSLACVFAEIFTVYKGGTYQDFLEFRRKKDLKNGDGWFCNTVPAVITWLEGLAKERCDVQIIGLLRAMLCKEPKHRPDAEQVWKILTACTSSTNTLFCRPCCMPVVCKDSTLTRQMNAEPSMEEDPPFVPGRELVPVPTDLSFNTIYKEDEELALQWVRNLRHWPHALLDVVRTTESHHPLARKRIDAKEGSTLAIMEAEILSNVRHHHVVTLHATYQQGHVYGLLFEPATDYDLRSYMELAELRMVHNSHIPVDIKFLTESLGCLASALTAVHAVGYDHGDIRPENILVHERRVFLSKFSLGLRCENTGPTGSSRPQGPYRYIDWFGRLNLGRQDEPDSSTRRPRPFDSAAVQYKPPEWNDTEPESVGQPAADVFALGCVFLEILTVLRGKRVRDLNTFRAKDEARVAYRQSLPRTFEWLKALLDDDSDSSELLQTTIYRMLETDPSKRPTAQEVHDIMRRCKTSSGVNLCGRLCLR